MKRPTHEIVTEIHGLKFADDRSFCECAKAIISVLLDMCKTSTIPNHKSTFTDVINKHGGLLSEFIPDDEEQVELIFSIQEYFEEEENNAREELFQQVLHILYDNEILSEDNIVKWAKEQNAIEDPLERRFVDMCKPFLDWLATAEEEED